MANGITVEIFIIPNKRTPHDEFEEEDGIKFIETGESRRISNLKKMQLDFSCKQTQRYETNNLRSTFLETQCVKIDQQVAIAVGGKSETRQHLGSIP